MANIIQQVTLFYDDQTTVDGVTVTDSSAITAAHATCSTDGTHARPYLMLNLAGVDKATDLIQGSTAVSMKSIQIQDTRTIANDQQTGWLTKLLADVGGRSALMGQRIVEQQKTPFSPDFKVTMDGIITGIKLSDTKTYYTIEVKDMRERERALSLFYRSETVVFPVQETAAGIVNGFGVAGGYGRLNPYDVTSPQLIPDAKGIHCKFRRNSYDVLMPAGAFELQDVKVQNIDDWNTHYLPYNAQTYDKSLEQADKTPNGSFRTGYVNAGMTIQWRAWNTNDAWVTLRFCPIWQVTDAVYAAHTPAGLFDYPLGYVGFFSARAMLSDPINVFLRALFPKNWTLQAIAVTANTLGELPTSDQDVEVRILSGLAPTQDVPMFVEMTYGQFLKNCYDGVYSSTPAKVRYNADVMDDLVANSPIMRAVITDAEDDGKTWLEENWYKPLGYIPRVNGNGEITPYRWALPDASEALVELNTSNVIKDSWEHMSDDAVSRIEFTYYRDFIDRVGAFNSIEVFNDEMSAPSETQIGSKPVTYKPVTVRDVTADQDGGMGGSKLFKENELGFRLFKARAYDLLDRFMLGGQHVTCEALRSDASIEALQEGQWVIAGNVSLPDYQTKLRGMSRLMQVITISDNDPLVRKLELVDAGPHATPLAAPSIVDASITNGVLTVEVADVPETASVRLEVASKNTLPANDSGEWLFAERQIAAVLNKNHLISSGSDPINWTAIAGGPLTIEDVSGTTPPRTNWALRSPTGVNTQVLGTDLIPVDLDRVYTVTASIRRVANATGRFYMGIALLDANLNNIEGNGTYWYTGAVSATPINETWTTYSGKVGKGITTKTGLVGFPPNAKYMKTVMLVNYTEVGSPTGYYEVQELRVGLETEHNFLTTKRLPAGEVFYRVRSEAPGRRASAWQGLASETVPTVVEVLNPVMSFDGTNINLSYTPIGGYDRIAVYLDLVGPGDSPPSSPTHLVDLTDTTVGFAQLYTRFPQYYTAYVQVKAFQTPGSGGVQGPLQLVGVMTRQDVTYVPPVVAVSKTEDPIDGTLTLTLTDPQVRQSQVQFRTIDAAGTDSGWVNATLFAPYTATVTKNNGQLTGQISWRVYAYDATKVSALIAEGTELFPRVPVTTLSAFAKVVAETDATVTCNVTVVDPNPYTGGYLVIAVTGQKNLQGITVAGQAVSADVLVNGGDLPTGWDVGNITVTNNAGTDPSGAVTTQKVAAIAAGTALWSQGMVAATNLLIGEMEIAAGNVANQIMDFYLAVLPSGAQQVGVSINMTTGEFVAPPSGPGWAFIEKEPGGNLKLTMICLTTPGLSYVMRGGFDAAAAGDYVYFHQAALRTAYTFVSNNQFLPFVITKPAEGVGPGAFEVRVIDVHGQKTGSGDRIDVQEETVAEVLNLTAAMRPSGDALITAIFDADTYLGTGNGGGRYRIDGGSWTQFDVPTATRTYQFAVAISPTANKTVEVQAQNKSASWGAIATVVVNHEITSLVTPLVKLSQTGQTSSTTTYTATLTNPSGGTAPTGTVTLYNCAGSVNGVATGAGGSNAIANGQTIVVTRNSSVTDTMAMILLVGSIAGQGSASVSMVIPPQLNLGPTLVLEDAHTRVDWTVSIVQSYGTITYRYGNSGSWSAFGSSQVVSRQQTPFTLFVRASADGQDFVVPVQIGAYDFYPIVTSDQISVLSATDNTVRCSWVWDKRVMQGGFYSAWLLDDLGGWNQVVTDAAISLTANGFFDFDLDTWGPGYDIVAADAGHGNIPMKFRILAYDSAGAGYSGAPPAQYQFPLFESAVATPIYKA